MAERKIQMSERMHLPRANSVMGLDPRSDSENTYPKLHAMGFGELLDTAFSLYRSHFRAFVAIASCFCIVMFLIFSGVCFDNAVGRDANVGIWILIIGVFLAGFIFVVSGLIFAGAEAYLGRHIKIGAVLKQARHRFLRCFGGSLLLGLLAVLFLFFSGVLLVAILTASLGNTVDIIGPLSTLLLAAVVVAWFVTYWCFFVAAVLVEGEVIGNAFRRSHELISGAWWRIVGTMFAILFLHLAVSIIMRIAIGSLLNLTRFMGVMEFLRTTQWTTLLQLLINKPEASFSYMLMFLINLGLDIFTMPIWVIGVTLLYFNQRIRKEGFDIEVMATRHAE